MRSASGSIYDCVGPSRARPLTRGELSPEIREAVRRLQRREPHRNRRIVALLGIWGGSAAIALSSGSLLLQAPACLLSAGALIGLSVIMHEASHRLLFRSRRLNWLVGFCCGVPVLISLSAYRALHLRHHAFEGTPGDPDAIEAAAGAGRPLVLVYYGLLLLGTYLYFPHVAMRGFRLVRGRDRLLMALEYGAILAVAGLAFVLAPGATLRVWVLPMIVAAQLTNLRSIAEHGLTTAGNPFTASRSVRSNRMVRYFLCNLNYHLEHHLFPAVPWYNLPRLSQLLEPAFREAGSSAYRSYTRFFLDFFRTTRAGLLPRVRLLPARLRRELCEPPRRP